MIKKTSAIVLGLVLVISAVAMNGNAGVNYSQILDKKITKDKTLRRFSGGMRRGSSNKYTQKTVTKKTLNQTFGFVRPRTIKSTTEESALEIRTNTNRINSVSANRSNVAIETVVEKQKIENVSFKNEVSETKNTEKFVLELDKTLFTKESNEAELSAENDDDIRFLIKKMPTVSAEISFESTARSIATAQLNKNLDVDSADQARKVVSHFGKNHVTINQAIPTRFFEKISITQKYGVSFIIVQRIQEDPMGGFYYLEVVGRKKSIKEVVNIANQSFKTFNLK